MRKVIALSLSLLACSVQAQSNVCSLTEANVDKVVKVKGVPGFFFKVHPSGDYISYIELSHNTLIDLNTGIEHPMVGNIDPVWSPDGSFLTSPGVFGTGRGIEFFTEADALETAKKGTAKSVKGIPTGMDGVYQSIGKTGPNDYTIISDDGGVNMGKFKVDNAVPEWQSNQYQPCGNIDNFPTDLPMLSKDGKFLSVYDTEGSTKIYRLNGFQCELALDLGFATGKVSFNKDSSQIAFHVDEFSDFHYGYFSGITKDKVKNVMVLKLNETDDGKLVPSEWALASKNVKPGDGGYYPDFDNQGNVYYLEDIDNNFQFVKVGQKNLEFKPMASNLLFGKTHCVNCQTEKKKKSTTEILAQLWVSICSEQNIPMNENIELVMTMDPAACREMVEDNWIPGIGITKEDLLSKCPEKEYTKPEVVGKWDPKQKSTAEDLIKGKCIYCHKQPRTYETHESVTVWTGPDDSIQEDVIVKNRVESIDLDKMDSVLAGQMLTSLQKGTMPKGNSVNQEEKATMMEYIQRRMLDLPKKKLSQFLRVRRYTPEYLEEKRQKALSDNANGSEEEKQAAVNYMNCRYGQDCGKHLVDLRKSLESEAKSQSTIDDEIMYVKCDNLYDVSIEECRAWDLKR